MTTHDLIQPTHAEAKTRTMQQKLHDALEIAKLNAFSACLGPDSTPSDEENLLRSIDREAKADPVAFLKKYF